MIDHRQARLLAVTAIDFPLDAADRRDLEAHLHECRACRAELAAYRDDAARLATLPPVTPPAWVRGAIGQRRQASRTVLLAAAALLLLGSAGITLVVGSALRDAQNPPVPTPVAVLPSPAPTAAPGMSPGPGSSDQAEPSNTTATATLTPGRTPAPTYGASLLWSQDYLPRLPEVGALGGSNARASDIVMSRDIGDT